MTTTNTLQSIAEWHQQARPNPSDKDFNVQLGCHLEEVCEMLEALTFAAGNWPPIVGIATCGHTATRRRKVHPMLTT